MKAFLTLKPDFLVNRTWFLLGLLSLVIVDVLQLVIPRVLKHAIDDLTRGTISPNRLLLYTAQILVLAVLIGGFRYVWRQLLLGASRRMERSLRDRLFLHLQTLSLTYFSRTKVGDLMAHATNDVEAVRMAIGLGVVFLVDTMILGSLTICFMLYVHPLLTLYSILPMPLITAMTFYFSREVHDRFEQVQKAFAGLTEKIRESIGGIRVIKAYAQEPHEEKKISLLSQNYALKNIQVTKVWGLFFPIILLFSNLSMVIVLYLGGRLTLLGSISTGDFVAFMSYLGLLAWPMAALGWSINLVERGTASMERLNRIFEERPEMQNSEIPVRIDRLKGRIELRGVSFSVENGRKPLLHEVDLTVEEGERVVIVGRTGAGKTTLCNLLARVVESSAGSIRIDGVAIHHLPLGLLRRQVGYVPQDTFLFSDTIRENIAFGKLEATDDEIMEAAQVAQIYEEILRFPEGLDTVIGEKGVTLSGGQRQRIAIARALLMNPAIFILDDALSSVDLATEERILEGLEKRLQGRTMLFVSHRVSLLRRADRIVVMEEGRVVEAGNHEKLLAKEGTYADLYWREQWREELEHENSRSS